MLHIIGQSPATGENEVLRAMFAARKQIFVDLLGWDVPVSDGRYEIDQFDDEHAIYLVIGARDGAHLASARLLPTVRPHILADLYAGLCKGDVPCGPDIFEVTRFCLDRGINAVARRNARDQLVSALTVFAIANGINRYTGVAELAWLSQILRFGWRSRPLGLPQMIDGRMLGALEIEIDAETPHLLAQTGVFTELSDMEDARHAA